MLTIFNNPFVDLSILLQCYEMFNAPDSKGLAPAHPLCSAEVKIAMDGAVDSETCWRRSNMVNNLEPREFSLKRFITMKNSGVLF